MQYDDMLSIFIVFVYILYTFCSALCRHTSRFPCPAPRPCSCRRSHSDAKLKDPFTLAQKDLTSLYDDIKKVHVTLKGRHDGGLLQ